MAAEFIYPQYGNYTIVNNGHEVNVFDTLNVQYRTSWPAVNLTLFCLQWNQTSHKPYWYDMPSNPCSSSGLYSFPTMNAIGYWTVFPTSCLVRLTKFGDNDTKLDGEIWWATSKAGTSTTFLPDRSATAASVSTAIKSSTTTLVFATTSVADITANTSAPNLVPATSQGLDTGAKVGIGVGAAVALLIIVALLLIITYVHRKGSMRKATALERTAYVNELSTEEKPISNAEGHHSVIVQELDGRGFHEMAGASTGVHEVKN